MTTFRTAGDASQFVVENATRGVCRARLLLVRVRIRSWFLCFPLCLKRRRTLSELHTFPPCFSTVGPRPCSLVQNPLLSSASCRWSWSAEKICKLYLSECSRSALRNG